MSIHLRIILFTLFIFCSCSSQSEKEKDKSVIANVEKANETECYETIQGISKIVTTALSKVSKESVFSVPDTIYIYQRSLKQGDTFPVNIGDETVTIVNKILENLNGEKTLFRIENFNENSGEVEMLLQHVFLVKDFEGEESIIKSGISFSLNGNIDDSSCILTVSSTSTIEY